MKIGDSVETRHSYSTADMNQFAALSGAEVQGTVPEPLIAALFSYLLGVHLPGPGTNYLKQDLNFRAAAPLDTPLTARVEVARLRPDTALVDLWATCTAADGTVICEGRALVKARDVGA